MSDEVEEHFRDAIAEGLVEVEWTPGEWRYSLTDKGMEAVTEDAVKAAVIVAAERLSEETGIPSVLCANLIMNYDMNIFDPE